MRCENAKNDYIRIKKGILLMNLEIGRQIGIIFHDCFFICILFIFLSNFILQYFLFCFNLFYFYVVYNYKFLKSCKHRKIRFELLKNSNISSFSNILEQKLSEIYIANKD